VPWVPRGAGCKVTNLGVSYRQPPLSTTPRGPDGLLTLFKGELTLGNYPRK